MQILFRRNKNNTCSSKYATNAFLAGSSPKPQWGVYSAPTDCIVDYEGRLCSRDMGTKGKEMGGKGRRRGKHPQNKFFVVAVIMIIL